MGHLEGRSVSGEIKDMGGQVRKGEKATHVLFYKFDDEREKAPASAPDTPASSPDGTAERDSSRPPMVRCYAVFNVEQADGLTLERPGDDPAQEPEWKAHQTAARVIQESGIHVAHVRGDRAFYNLQTDKVTLPEREQFASANGYYQTALHELGHATGHPARMDRDTLKAGAGKFGSVEYAREALRAWGVAHAPLWAALRARTFAVQVVGVGVGAEAADRAAPLLKYWTQDGDGTGIDNPTGQTQADPEISQEIARLKEGTSGGNRSLLREWGGYRPAVERLMGLRQLPEGTPTKTKARGAIDRFQIWSTSRLTGPEVAI